MVSEVRSGLGFQGGLFRFNVFKFWGGQVQFVKVCATPRGEQKL